MGSRCGYLNAAKAAALEQDYESILGKVVSMISHPDQWTIRTVQEEDIDYG